SGMVRDKATGKPLARYTVSTVTNATWAGNAVSMNSASKQVQAATDESGRYRLNGLPAGNYRITVRPAEGPVLNGTTTKSIALAGHDLEDVNFDVAVIGAVRGRVLDENKEPIAGISVLLVSREYYLGQSGYFLKGGVARTNDRGEYTLRLQAGHPYFLLAENRRGVIPAYAETPLNPKLRRRVGV